MSTKRKADELSNTVTVTVDDLKALALRGVTKLGYNAADSETLVDVMMFSQLRGGNQGLIKIITNGLNKDPNSKEPTVVHSTKLSARIDGGQSVGMKVAMKATSMAIEKAKEHGFGMVGTFNTCTSTGSLGAYVKKIAEEGLIGFAFAQSPEFVAPFGAYQAIFGTNPIAFGVPRLDGHEPLVMDQATAAFPFFGLLEAKTAGRSIPDNVAYGPDGNPTTDPAQAIAGAIRVFDRNYKGSNLSLMVELLAGPLVRAATSDKKAAKNWGNLVIAIDPELMGDVEEFKKGTQVVLERVKNAKKLPGVTEIKLPGERGNAMYAQAIASGHIEVEKNLYEGMVKFADA